MNLRLVMANINVVLTALADPTRRQVFEHVARQPSAVSAIALHVPVTRPAVSQHLKVLRQAGLVTSRTEGTRHIYSVNPTGLTEVRTWLDGMWGEAMTAFAAEFPENSEEG